MTLDEFMKAPGKKISDMAMATSYMPTEIAIKAHTRMGNPMVKVSIPGETERSTRGNSVWV